MKKVFLVIVLLSLIAAGLFYYYKDAIARKAIVHGVEVITGLKMKIGSMQVGFLTPQIKVKNLVIYNPDGFADKVMADVPLIYIKFKPFSIFTQDVHFYELELDLKQFTVVKNDKGELNINMLKVVQDKKQGKERPDSGDTKNFEVDKLHLKIDKIVYKDYSRQTPPVVREFDVNIDEEYENVDNLYDLGSVVIVRALNSSALAQILSLDLGFLKAGLQNVLHTTTDVLQKTTGTAVGTLKTLTDTITEGAQDILHLNEDKK